MQRNTRIRPATPDDLDQLARIHAITWRDIYGPVLPVHVVDPHLDVPRVKDALAVELRKLGAVAGVWIAELVGEIVGFAYTVRTPEGPRPVELKRLYTLPQAHGTGLAKQLMDAAIGNQPAWLWLLEGNDRAEAFYRKHGFVREEPRVEKSFGAEYPADIRMLR
ncbi:MAG: GNAT family N-acetyltransferase [Gulosibacter sp.]|uniref:GNAT family N-acetyltransferase n=1 Tax=Gulosibacter sp. TaxID=2817531 RepID=UPI003F912B48